jgi:hypothetical protein
LTGDAPWSADRGCESVSENLCALRFLEFTQQDYEFVAAESCGGVDDAGQRTNSIGDLLQERVAHFMAEGVVDRLHAVEVSEDERTAALESPGAPESLSERIVESESIGQSGERIGPCFVSQLCSLLIMGPTKGKPERENRPECGRTNDEGDHRGDRVLDRRNDESVDTGEDQARNRPEDRCPRPEKIGRAEQDRSRRIDGQASRNPKAEDRISECGERNGIHEMRAESIGLECLVDRLQGRPQCDQRDHAHAGKQIKLERERNRDGHDRDLKRCEVDRDSRMLGHQQRPRSCGIRLPIGWGRARIEEFHLRLFGRSA